MNKTRLKNGITIITKRIASSHAVSIGFWIKTGSIHENNKERGYAHFLEHMIFKGTKKRSAKQIAQEIDSAGAYINAITAKEYTAYYINIIHDKIDLALDILTDILENSVFNSNEIQKEKQVVLEEIKMYKDTTSELVHDKLIEAMLWGHPIGYPILGDENTIKGITDKKLINFFLKHYLSHNIIISASGNISHKKIVDHIIKKKFFNKYTGLEVNNNNINIKTKPRSIILTKKLEQIHLCLGFPSIPITNKSRYALYTLNAIFGSSMSSRLFQEIRESMGLCYSIYSFNSLYKNTGVFGIYAGTGINFFEKTLKEILKQIKKIKKNKLSKQEIINAKEHLKGNMALSYENIDTHMNSLARQEIYFKKHITFKEQLQMVDKIKPEDIHKAIQIIFPDDYKIIVSSIGHSDHKKILKKTNLSI